ncbi:unnamed protein product [Clonostachys rosea f. rosea IK726]|uniref:Uncharacterized protein n=1 Tax=Clonostachys rosea f. rosea IK726 TaxID=1349383 RepID=A0ACA9U1S9_BIOOC|nr:unnamed protein product [Clonostachys rosea f. rosea IK726]
MLVKKRLVVGVAVIFLFWLLLSLRQPQNISFRSSKIPPALNSACKLEEKSASSCDERTGKHTIPNIVHYVYLLPRSSDDLQFQFSHFLSVYSAYYYWNPNEIYLHTNADSASLARAKSGSSGKWSSLLLTLPVLVVNEVKVPTHAENGKEIQNIEHKSDFVRVQAVYDYGGIYIDMDVFPLRDIKDLRERGYSAVAGRQHAGELNSGTFMSIKGGRVMKRWMERMTRVYDGQWTTHSNIALTHVAERREEGCDMLILHQDAFAPGSWESEDVSLLFHTHEEGTRLFGLASRLGWTPKWAHDWSCTYLLHAFHPRKERHGFKHNDITPSFVLAQRSNFGRAVYPVAKSLYDQGLIGFQDTDLGLEALGEITLNGFRT